MAFDGQRTGERQHEVHPGTLRYGPGVAELFGKQRGQARLRNQFETQAMSRDARYFFCPASRLSADSYEPHVTANSMVTNSRSRGELLETFGRPRDGGYPAPIRRLTGSALVILSSVLRSLRNDSAQTISQLGHRALELTQAALHFVQILLVGATTRF